MQPFTERAVALIRAIPEGSVMTYGQIAAMAGSPRGARQVVRILHAMSESQGLPWHRVVNGKGEIALREEEFRDHQRLLLEAEGVAFLANGAVDMAAHQFHPDPLY